MTIAVAVGFGDAGSDERVSADGFVIFVGKVDIVGVADDKVGDFVGVQETGIVFVEQVERAFDP